MIGNRVVCGRHGRSLGLVPFVALCCAVALALGARPARADAEVTRLGGQTRAQTMERIVNEGFTRSEWAVVATQDNFPDALAASSLAGTRSCPVLLTGGRHLSDETTRELSRLGVRYVYLMGGEAAVGDEVDAAIRAMGIQVFRLAGSDRIATSIAALGAVREAGSVSDTVIVATGSKFADSLSIGPYAYATGSPILLAKSDGTLSAEAVEAIRQDPYVRNVVVVGGTSVVSDAVKGQLGGYTFQRLGGTDRYDTSRKVAEATPAALDFLYPCVATGENYPDALAGAALAGTLGSPLILVPSSAHGKASSSTHTDRLDPAIETLGAHAQEVRHIYVLGGTSAVDADVADALAGACLTV